MDPTQLAETISVFLAPYLPYLVKGGLAAGKSAAKEMGKGFAASAWTRAESLWAKLQPKIETKPSAQEAVAEVMANPEDADALAGMCLQMKKLFAEDTSLAEEMTHWVEEAQTAQVIVVASGDRSVAMGRNSSGNTIITGDQNTIK